MSSFVCCIVTKSYKKPFPWCNIQDHSEEEPLKLSILWQCRQPCRIEPSDTGLSETVVRQLDFLCIASALYFLNLDTKLDHSCKIICCQWKFLHEMKIVMLKSMLCAAFVSSDASRDNSQSLTDIALSAGSTPRSCPPSVEKIKEETQDALESSQCRKNISTLIFSFYLSSIKPMTTSISNLLTTKRNAVLIF